MNSSWFNVWLSSFNSINNGYIIFIIFSVILFKLIETFVIKSFYNKKSKNNYNHFFIDNAKNNKFSSINNCTFNNYLKNLN